MAGGGLDGKPLGLEPRVVPVRLRLARKGAKMKVAIAESSIHGIGLFAVCDIPKGDVIIEYEGEHISVREACRREERNRLVGKTYILAYNEKFSIDGAIGGNESRYANHSCDPNCHGLRRAGRAWYIASKKIRCGEEITVDYSFDADDELVSCHCGSPACRGTINEK